MEADAGLIEAWLAMSARHALEPLYFGKKLPEDTSEHRIETGFEPILHVPIVQRFVDAALDSCAILSRCGG